MEHHLKIVARNYHLDQKELEEFALQNPKKYGISNVDGFITTTTWYTEDLIKDFSENKLKTKENENH